MAVANSIVLRRVEVNFMMGRCRIDLSNLSGDADGAVA
jgi:hypothetical protein